jgi:hypothetical protein
MTPNTDEKQNITKQYVSEDLQNESIYEVEGVKGVHHDDHVSDSFANANANSGGKGMMGMESGLGSGSGMGVGMSGLSAENNEENSGGLSASSISEGVVDEDANSNSPLLGSGNAGMGGFGLGSAGSENTDDVENQLDDADELTETKPVINDEAGSALSDLIYQVKEDEIQDINPTLPEVVTEDTEVQSESTVSSDSQSTNTTTTPETSASGTESTTQTQEGSEPETVAESQNSTSDQILALNGPVETTVDPSVQILAQATLKGRNAGVEAGCSIGLGKKVTKPGNDFVIGQDLPESDEEALNKYVSDQKAILLNAPLPEGTSPELAAKIKENRAAGFNSGFNHGYTMGRQMKVNLKKALLVNSPDYKEGFILGDQAGTLSGSGKEAEAEALTKTATGPEKSENYKKGYFAAFNKKYAEARLALSAARHPSPEKLKETSENYNNGFSWGERIGTASAKNEISDEEVSQASANASANCDESGTEQTKEEGQPVPLFQKGYFAGFNSGYISGRQVVAATRKKANAGPEEGDSNYSHFIAGRFKGGLSAFLGEDSAIQALINRDYDLSQVAGNLDKIPEIVYEYFEQGVDLDIYETSGLTDAEKEAKKENVKFFEMGYFKQFNKMYIIKQQNSVKKKHNERTGHPDFDSGALIGNIAGQAEAVKERLLLKVKGITDAAKLQELNIKILKITSNLANISEKVKAANEHYQQGYFSAFSLAYQFEKAAGVAAKKEGKKNQAAQGAASGTAYGSGYETGTAFGSAIAQKLASHPNAEENDKIDNRIKSAMDLAKGQGEEYASGFISAFNTAIINGNREGNASLDEKSLELKTNFTATLKTRGDEDKANKKFYQKFFTDGKEFAFDKFFIFHKTGTGKDPVAELKAHIKKLGKEIQENANPSNKDVDEEEKLPQTFKSEANAGKLKKEFTDGAELGKEMGTQAGQRFKAGYDVGMSGDDAAGTDYFYMEGYKAGQSDSEYRDLSDAVFAASGLTHLTSDNYEVSQHEGELASLSEEQRAPAMAAFREGFNKHFNAWCKIFTLLQGQQLSKEFESVDINLLGGSDKGSPGSDVLVAAKTEEKKSDVINTQANEKKPALQIKANELGMSVDILIDEFKKGYQQAIDSAKSKIEDKAKDEALYNTGILHGINTDKFLEKPENQSIAEEILGKSKKLEAQLQAMELTEDVFTKKDKYREGKSRGLQIQTFIVAGLGSMDDFSLELQGPAYKEAYLKGYKSGESDGEKASQNIMQGNPLPEKTEEKTSNLSPELQDAHNAGFERGYLTKIEYLRGYSKAYNQITNDNADDDFDNTVENNITYRSSYQEGIRDGRKQAMLDKAAGTFNQAQQTLSDEALRMNQAITNKLKTLMESGLGSRAEGIESGYQEAVKFTESLENGNNIAALKANFLEKGGDSGIKKLKGKIKLMIETVSVEQALNQVLAPKFTLILDSLNKIKGQKKESSLSEKFNSLAGSLPEIFEVKEGLSNSNTRIIDLLTESCKDFASEFKAGFDKGSELGLQDGEKLRSLRNNVKAVEKKSDDADNFFASMENSMANEGEKAYSDGYDEAVSMAYRLVKVNPDKTQVALEKMEYQGITNIRAAVRKLISEEYSTYRNEEVDKDNYYDVLIHHNTSLAYRKILTALKSGNSSTPEENANVELLIDSELDTITTELESGFEDVAEESIKTYFQENIDHVWKDFILIYRKGFNQGFKFGVKQGIVKRDGSISSKSAGADADLQAIHEMLSAGHIADGLISDLDLNDAQNELRKEAGSYRAIIEKSEDMVYDTEKVIFDLLDEVNSKKELITAEPAEEPKPEDLTELTDQEFAELLNLDNNAGTESSAVAKEQIKALENDIIEQREILKNLNNDIDPNIKEYLQFMRTTGGFEAPEDSITALRDYLKDDAADLELDGQFNFSEGNSKIDGSGKLVIEDSRERINYYGKMLLALGDLSFTSSGMERDDIGFYVTLKEGTVTVPKTKGGKNGELSFRFDRLDFEMGLGIIEQLEQQLNLDDALTGGNVLTKIDL